MSLNSILATAPLTTSGYHIKANGTTLGNSLIWDNGTNVGIGNTNTSYTLDVNGTGRFSGLVSANAGIYQTNAASDIESNNWGVYNGGSTAMQFTYNASGSVVFTNGTPRLTIASTGAATFSGTVYTGGATTASGLTGASELIVQNEIGIQCTDTTGPYLRMVAGSVNQDFTFVVNALSGTIPNLLFNVNSAERMRITSGGNVLINQTTDQLSTYKLQVTGNARFNDSIIFPTAAAANAGDMYLGQGSKYSGGFTANDFLLINQGSSSAGIVQITAGVVTNGVYLARNANSWSAVSSDVRNKKDFETTQGLAEVLQIEPVKYNYIWDEEGETKRLGFTAQNLQSLIPEMVIATGKKADDGSDYLTITPDYLLPVLVKAIQEMNTKLDEQNQTIQSLQEQINILAK